jgi:hypothetical protein
MKTPPPTTTIFGIGFEGATFEIGFEGAATCWKDNIDNCALL